MTNNTDTKKQAILDETKEAQEPIYVAPIARKYNTTEDYVIEVLREASRRTTTINPSSLADVLSPTETVDVEETVTTPVKKAKFLSSKGSRVAYALYLVAFVTLGYFLVSPFASSSDASAGSPALSDTPFCEQEVANYEHNFEDADVDLAVSFVAPALRGHLNCVLEQNRLTSFSAEINEGFKAMLLTQADGTIEYLYLSPEANSLFGNLQTLTHELVHVMQRDCMSQGRLLAGMDVDTWVEQNFPYSGSRFEQQNISLSANTSREVLAESIAQNKVALVQSFKTEQQEEPTRHVTVGAPLDSRIELFLNTCQVNN